MSGPGPGRDPTRIESTQQPARGLHAADRAGLSPTRLDRTDPTGPASYKPAEYGHEGRPHHGGGGYEYGHETRPHHGGGGAPPVRQQTYRIYCKAGEDKYSLASRDGKVCLVRTDRDDDTQVRITQATIRSA